MIDTLLIKMMKCKMGFKLSKDDRLMMVWSHISYVTNCTLIYYHFFWSIKSHLDKTKPVVLNIVTKVIDMCTFKYSNITFNISGCTQLYDSIWAHLNYKWIILITWYTEITHYICGFMYRIFFPHTYGYMHISSLWIQVCSIQTVT